MTPLDALKQIPTKDIENLAIDLLDELRNEFAQIDSDDYEKALSLIKKHIDGAILRALWKLEPVTIIGPPETDD